MLCRQASRLSRSPLSRGVHDIQVLVPKHIKCPDYAHSGIADETAELSTPPILKDEPMLAKLRQAGILASEMRSYAGSLVKAGITTQEINIQVHDAIIKRGAYPSPLNYFGFPKSIFTSVNEQLCQGIPNRIPLKENDCVKIDLSVYLDGVHGDCCGTFFVGSGTDEARELARVCRHSVMESMKLCKPDIFMSDIGNCIQRIADAHKVSISDHFTGYGIGASLHEAPFVFHRGGIEHFLRTPMEEGMVFTIEPIMCAGNSAHEIQEDCWTAVSIDKSIAVQHKEMVAVTADGFELLTVEPSSSSD